MQRSAVIKYAESLIVCTSDLSGFGKFVFLLLKLRKISSLLDEIHELMDDSSKVAFKRQQEIIVRNTLILSGIVIFIAFVRMICMICTGQFDEIHRFFFDTSFLSVRIVCSLLALASDITNGFFGFIILVFFYSVCVQVAVLYQQLGWEIRKLNDETEDRRKIVKDCVDLHVRIIDVCRSVQDCFANILLCESLSLTTVIGLLLYNITSGLLPIVNLFMIPSMLCVLFLICRGGSLIAHESEAIAVRMYDELKWYENPSKDLGRSVQIIMQQLQNPQHLRLMRLQRVNLEFFVDVS